MLKVEKNQKLFKLVTRISHSEIFDILQPLWPSIIVPKFIHFRSVINFLQRSAFWDLADFWPIFRVFERPKVCAFISEKLSKLRRRFFTFPDNFCRSTRIRKNIPSGVMVRGLQCPKNAPRSQNFKIFTFARPLCPNALCQQFRTDFILHPTGPCSDPHSNSYHSLHFAVSHTRRFESLRLIASMHFAHCVPWAFTLSFLMEVCWMFERFFYRHDGQ